MAPSSSMAMITGSLPPHTRRFSLCANGVLDMLQHACRRTYCGLAFLSIFETSLTPKPQSALRSVQQSGPPFLDDLAPHDGARVPRVLQYERRASSGGGEKYAITKLKTYLTAGDGPV